MGKTVAGIISLLQEFCNEEAFLKGEDEANIPQVRDGLGCDQDIVIDVSGLANRVFILFLSASAKAAN